MIRNFDHWWRRTVEGYRNKTALVNETLRMHVPCRRPNG